MPAEGRRLACCLLAATTLFAGCGSTDRDNPGEPSAVEAAVAEALDAQADMPAIAADVFDRIVPSLVLVSAGQGDDAALGTGVIINRDGDILTALHVVDGADTIEVQFADGTRAPASVGFDDPDQDIAMLDAAGRPAVLVPAVLGSPLTVDVGDPVFAVGNPLGLTASMSAGVLSGRDRQVPIGERRVLAGLLQFDAAVNPGSSGGPLLNEQAQVIGIVTALAAAAEVDEVERARFSGIGFAVPIESASGGIGGPAK